LCGNLFNKNFICHERATYIYMYKYCNLPEFWIWKNLATCYVFMISEFYEGLKTSLNINRSFSLFSIVFEFANVGSTDKVRALRAFRVLRPLRLVSGVPSKSKIVQFAANFITAWTSLVYNFGLKQFFLLVFSAFWSSCGMVRKYFVYVHHYGKNPWLLQKITFSGFENCSIV